MTSLPPEAGSTLRDDACVTCEDKSARESRTPTVAPLAEPLMAVAWRLEREIQGTAAAFFLGYGIDSKRVTRG